jgi:hypothetical protein
MFTLAAGKTHVMYNMNGDPLYMVRIPQFNIEGIDPLLGFGVHCRRRGKE